MESSEEKTRPPQRSQIRRDLIISAWNEWGRPAIGEKQLRSIEQTIRDRLGEGAVESPAAIARLLAEEGAELRHPEIIESDARWREAEFGRNLGKFESLEELWRGKQLLRLSEAAAFMLRLEGLRKQLDRESDNYSWKRLRDMVIDARLRAQSQAKSQTLDEAQRAEQREIAEWLAVWLQTPNLFEDWLELRRRSKDFKKFLT